MSELRCCCLQETEPLAFIFPSKIEIHAGNMPIRVAFISKQVHEILLLMLNHRDTVSL